MGSDIGKIERITQNRILRLFEREAQLATPLADDDMSVFGYPSTLPYKYLGSLEDRHDNSNIIEPLLRNYLDGKYQQQEISAAVERLKSAAVNVPNGWESLYEANKQVYTYLRYGIDVNVTAGENTRTVMLIDWEHPYLNQFYVTEEVTIHDDSERRPDIVVYVNGIAIAVIELKRSKVSAKRGIRQNYRNQHNGYIAPFFSTIQLLLAGNDTEGLWYGAIKTPPKFWLRWKEPCGSPCEPSPYTRDIYQREIDCSLMQMMEPKRLLEFIHDFIIFDGGIKKLARPNQYFAIKAAERRIEKREGGIVWESQGSGKSLIMVWLAQWILENVADSRVVVITDRNELDIQIESGFKDAEKEIVRAKSGNELIGLLAGMKFKDKNPQGKCPDILCTLIHKFGNRSDKVRESVGDANAKIDLDKYLEEVRRNLPDGFKPKGKNIFVFIDECHRTQSGNLHEAMKMIMGDGVMIIGFTGTPLLKKDKSNSLLTFGRYIHTYKYDEAKTDGVVLDLRYEARNVDQHISSPEKIDEWFNLKTAGLSQVARTALKQRWAQMQKLFSSKERIDNIVADIAMDMERLPAFKNGWGNGILVANDIYQACRYWERFAEEGMADHVGLITSYGATQADEADEYADEAATEELKKSQIYQKMLNGRTTKQYEEWAKTQFVENPADMKLLIVVDKLLTGFDAPAATYLYLDKKMHDHGMFQAICRVNRVYDPNLSSDDDNDGCEDALNLKDFGFIVDYQEQIKNINGAVGEYTGAGLEDYSPEDIKGLLHQTQKEGRKDLEEALKVVDALCEPVTPKDKRQAYFDYFVYRLSTPADEQQAEQDANGPKRQSFYTAVGTLVRRYLNLANDMTKAGYSEEEAKNIKRRVDFYNDLRDEMKLYSGEALDLKSYDPAMRQLIDHYVKADDAEKIGSLTDMSILDYIDSLNQDKVNEESHEPPKRDPQSVAATLVANARKTIITQHVTDPKYYDNMSALLNQLIDDMRQGKMDYVEYLKQLKEQYLKLISKSHKQYPEGIDSEPRKALYSNLGNNAELAIRVDEAVRANKFDGFKGSDGPSLRKARKVRNAIKKVLEGYSESEIDEIMNIIKAQKEY